MSVRIEFKTSAPEGLLYFWGNKKFAQFIRVYLVDGHVRLDIRKSNKTRSIRIQQGPTLNDGKWHSVSMIKQMKIISLAVDEGESGSGLLSNAPVSIRILRRRFFVAGFPTKLRERRGFTQPTLAGCIRGLEFNERPLNILAYAQAARPCQSDGDPLRTNTAHIARGGYVVYDASRAPPGALELELTFRTAQSDGRIALIEDAAMEFFLDVQLKAARTVAVRVERKGVWLGGLEVESDMLCDSVWHRIFIVLHKTELLVAVDGREARVAISEVPNILAHMGAPVLYLGGAPGTFAERLGEAESLHGCFGGVDLSGVELNLRTYKRSLLGLCPYDH